MIGGLIELAPQHSYRLLPNFGDFYFDPKIQTARVYSGPNVTYGPRFDSRDQLIKYWTASDLDAYVASIDVLHGNNLWCPRQRLSARLVYTLYDLSFILSVLEGMQFGTPTLAANVTSIPEVTGDAALLVDPLDEAAITAALLQLANDSKHRDALSDLARRRAERFVWRNSVTRVLDVYSRVLSMPKRSK